MRLDRFLSECGRATRSESAKAVRAGMVSVNGTVAKRADQPVDPERDTVVYRGETVPYRKFVYLMMNKPSGVLSATEDGRGQTVLDLVPDELKRRDLFPCGRLDKDTVGLILLTNDGERAHRFLSPKRHVTKVYRFRSLAPLTEDDRARLEQGVDIGGYLTAPATVRFDGCEGEITVTEGKFHQIKRMFEAVGNRIEFLERIRFGTLVLDETLGRGECRPLTDEEERDLLALAD